MMYSHSPKVKELLRNRCKPNIVMTFTPIQTPDLNCKWKLFHTTNKKRLGRTSAFLFLIIPAKMFSASSYLHLRLRLSFMQHASKHLQNGFISY